MISGSFAFLDIETTGARSLYDRVIEIGILRVDDGKLTNTYQTLINPQTYISPFIEELTGIKKDNLEKAPIFSDVKDNILEILENTILVAHNVRFDYAFLKKEFAQMQHTFSMKHLCTVKLSRFLYPQHPRHNLSELIDRFHITCKNRHRAYDDASVLWKFFQIIHTQFPEEMIEQALKTVMKRPSLPASLPRTYVDDLPESPGVYIFNGENDVPLYIGKSKNIKERVLSHFTQDYASATDMKISQQIQSIKTIITAGELGALFKESQLIKAMQPLYNRQLRQGRKLIMLASSENKEGYLCISLKTVEKITPQETNNLLGIFKSKKQAEDFLFAIAKEYGLCHKLLHVEKTKSSCFMYRLGICKGACIQKESALSYNMRCIMAFSQHKIRPWPFNGPIVIEEKNEEHQLTELFFADKWCYLGSYKQDGYGTEEKVDQEYIFDIDVYKILNRYLLAKENQKKIRQLKHTQAFSFSAASLAF